MELIIKIIIILLAVFHSYVLYMEMFAWETLGRKTFRAMPRDLFPNTKSMAANQGLYNGFLVAGLIWSLLISDPIWAKNVMLFFLSCIAIAGIYGGYSVQKTIFFFQGLPALIGIALILLS
tara:strand:- start:2038 stop:2400 length:363 start_codon:yes stop_codon:yes gene_type:complete